MPLFLISFLLWRLSKVRVILFRVTRHSYLVLPVFDNNFIRNLLIHRDTISSGRLLATRYRGTIGIVNPVLRDRKLFTLYLALYGIRVAKGGLSRNTGLFLIRVVLDSFNFLRNKLVSDGDNRSRGLLLNVNAIMGSFYNDLSISNVVGFVLSFFRRVSKSFYFQIVISTNYVSFRGLAVGRFFKDASIASTFWRLFRVSATTRVFRTFIVRHGSLTRVFFRGTDYPSARLYTAFEFSTMAGKGSSIGVVVVRIMYLSVDNDMNGFYPR